MPDGTVAADLIDPHGIQFSDALPKLQGLAKYAENHPGVFRRIEAIAQIGSGFKAIDLTEATTVRGAVLAATAAKEVYESSQ